MTETLRGVCSSPQSSIDGEEDATSSSASRFSSSLSGTAAQSTRRSTAKKPRSTARKTIVPSRKRRNRTEPSPTSTHEMVHAAPRDFVAYLAEQLRAEQQLTSASAFGTTQDAIVQLPTAKQWPNKQQRDAFGRWVRSLGFGSSDALGRNVLCAAGAKADDVRRALTLDVASAPAYVVEKRAWGSKQLAGYRGLISVMELLTANDLFVVFCDCSLVIYLGVMFVMFVIIFLFSSWLLFWCDDCWHPRLGCNLVTDAVCVELITGAAKLLLRVTVVYLAMVTSSMLETGEIREKSTDRMQQWCG